MEIKPFLSKIQRPSGNSYTTFAGDYYLFVFFFFDRLHYNLYTGRMSYGRHKTIY